MAELSGGRSAALRAMRKAARFAGTLALAAIAATVAGCNEEMGPLHRAAATGDIEAVKAWIAGGRNLDATYDEPSTTLEGNYARQQGVTALIIAAGMGRIEIARLLVEGGANLYAESRWRDGSNTRNAFDHAAEADLRMKPQLAVIELLARSGADTAMYASASARSQLPILAKCCSRTPHSDTQRRICNMFGL